MGGWVGPNFYPYTSTLLLGRVSQNKKRRKRRILGVKKDEEGHSKKRRKEGPLRGLYILTQESVSSNESHTG